MSLIEMSDIRHEMMPMADRTQQTISITLVESKYLISY